jgi:branched-chain amino acid transport system substrate-binding protein
MPNQRLLLANNARNGIQNQETQNAYLDEIINITRRNRNLAHKFMSLAGLRVIDQFRYDKYFQIFPFGPDANVTFAQGFFEVAMTTNPKPKTVAISVPDSEFPQTAAIGAREWTKKYGLKLVYDRSFPPNAVDFGPIVRAIQAAAPDIVYVTCFPPNAVGIVRAVRETGFKPMLIGGGMVGPQYASVKQQLGPLLNGFLSFETFVPEPTTNFPGIKDFLGRYKPKAVAAGVDALGYYLPPFSYAGMQWTPHWPRLKPKRARCRPTLK